MDKSYQGKEEVGLVFICSQLRLYRTSSRALKRKREPSSGKSKDKSYHYRKLEVWPSFDLLRLKDKS
jgi:hypothetical protein